MREGLEERVSRACLLIRHGYRQAWHRGSHLELAYSGGKDSDVLLSLCRDAGILGSEWLRPLHRCTTIDPPGTLSHCRANGVEVLRPRKDFAHCIMSSGFPTMFTRHCCGELKEYAVEDYVLVGVRRSESVKRAKRYTCDEDLVTYNGRGKCIQYYPLLDWSDEDIAEYIDARGIKCHPLYYDERGKFHVERRLGCMGCPLQYYKKRIEDFKLHPRMVLFWCRYGQRYLDTHHDVKVHEHFADVYEWFVCNLFCRSIEEFRARFVDGGLFGGRVDCKRYLEDYFDIDLMF